MKTTINAAGSGCPDLFTAIGESIRGVSPKAKTAMIGPDSRLLDDLALDSLDLIAVILKLQDEFLVEIDPDDIPEMQTVADLASSLANLLRHAA